jgi:dTDP-4-amino-4,6-dideoxygalactose transaminase
MATTKIEAIFQRRRQNYQILADSLPEGGPVKTLFSSLPDDTCPYVFPMVVKNGNKYLINKLLARGIPASGWPTLPPEITGSPEQHQAAFRVKNRLVLLPVHQDLTHRQLVWMTSALRQVIDLIR